MHLCYCIVSCAGSILTVSWILISVTNESWLTDSILCHNKGRNLTVCLKTIFEFCFSPLIRHILNKNVVENFSEFKFWFRREFYSNIFRPNLTLTQGLRCTFGVSETNKTVATGFIVFFNRNFAWNDVAIWFEQFFKIFRSQIFWNLTNKHIHFGETSNIWSK